MDRLAGQVARVWPCQETRHGRDLFRAATAAHQEDAPFPVRGLHAFAPGLDQPGRDEIDGDAARSELDCERFGETIQTSLPGHDMGPVDGARIGGKPAYVDDGGTAAFLERRERGSDSQGRTAERHRHYLAP